MKKRNKSVERNIGDWLTSYKEDCTFIEKQSDNLKALKYFDQFHDNKASERIINYIESGEIFYK